jgi:glycine C-acetyltransferase
LWDTRYSQDSEKKFPIFYGTEDTILYAAAFDANGGFLSLYWRRDAIISDSLNHASIIDGVR